MVTQSRIYTNEALFPNLYTSRNYNMRGNETVILDSGMMANMIAAPKSDIITYRDEWLNCIVFKDEAVLPNAAII